MRQTIYLPDELASEVKEQLEDVNISAICQAALRHELDKRKARAKFSADGFERVEAWDESRQAQVAFQGRAIGYGEKVETTAYLTARGAIAIVDDTHFELRIRQQFSDLDEEPALMTQIAEALGEQYVLELDI